MLGGQRDRLTRKVDRLLGPYYTTGAASHDTAVCFSRTSAHRSTVPDVQAVFQQRKCVRQSIGGEHERIPQSGVVR